MKPYGSIIVIMATAIALLLGGCSTPKGGAVPVQGLTASAPDVSSPVKVESVRLAAGGLMVDLRYRVVDRERGKLLFGRKTSITLTDEKTGTVLSVPSTPKIGKLRQVPADDESSRIYWIFFTNTGGVVRAGGKVALSIGDLRIRDLVVQ